MLADAVVASVLDVRVRVGLLRSDVMIIKLI
jgi:hypothetical protein